MFSSRLFLVLVIVAFVVENSLFSDDSKNPPSPEEVEQQLKSAEAEFEEARKMFNPWYAGPLITSSAHIIPPGQANIQPYIFITDNYAAYTGSGKSVDMDHLLQVKTSFILQFGILKWMQGVVVPQIQYNTQNGVNFFDITDTTATLGFGIQQETAYLPAVLFSIQESFPTGKYEHFNRGKAAVQGTGAGSFETTFTLNIGKVVWWATTHPMSLRFSFNYTIPAPVSVEGFNAYGGGYGTDGKVRPGNTFAGDFGYEYSFTQKWVAALDIVYIYSSSTHFSGIKGINKAGAEAVVGGPFSEQLSLAPALEYNVNENLAFLAGVWFTVWGRNSLDFASGVLSFTWTF